jgi:TRAP-type C4-dicarboxylate transport system substrate-binding protein
LGSRRSHTCWLVGRTLLSALAINKRVWESFDEGDQQLIEAAAASEYAVSLAEFNINNALALRSLRAEGAVKNSEVRCCDAEDLC